MFVKFRYILMKLKQFQTYNLQYCPINDFEIQKKNYNLKKVLEYYKDILYIYKCFSNAFSLKKIVLSSN